MPVIPSRSLAPSTNPPPQSLPLRLAALFGMCKEVPDSWYLTNGKAHGSHARRASTGHGGKLEPIPCTSYAELVAAWGEAMRWRDDMDDVLCTMLAVAISTEQIGDQLFLKVIGSAGCLHRDTLIHDPTDGTTKTVEQRWKDRKCFHVWSRLPSGQVAIAPAKPPIIFPVEDLYRVTFASGREVRVTAGHRFWGGDGYLSVRQVQDVLLSSGVCRLPSISESSLSALRPSAQHSSRTVQDWSAYCSAYSCPCGEQPHWELGTGLDVSPLPDDVLGRSRRSLHKDVPVSKHRCNHPYQLFSHPAKPGCHSPALTQHEYEGSGQIPLRTLQQLQTCIPIALHTPQRIDQTGTSQLTAVSSDYLGGEVASLQDCSALSGYIHSQERHPESSLLHLLSDRLCSGLESQRLPHLTQTRACGSSNKGLGYTAYTLPEWDEVVKVEPCGRDNYFDFHVPYTENYWAGGVFHHNSGKTRFCEGMLVSRSCYPLEHLTGFHSGWKGGSENGQDFSLLSRINRKTLITPEGDVLISSPQFQQIMSQQRRIFDGTSGASYKNMSEDQRYTGLRTPWIIAGTPALLDADQSRLGDRFIKVYFEDPDDEEKQHILMMVARSALKAVKLKSEEGDAEKQLQPEMAYAYQLTGGYVDWLKAHTELIEQIDVDDARLFRCTVLAEFAAAMRASQPKENHPTVELPTRLTSQMVRLACCKAVVLNKREVDQDVMRRVRKIAVDTSRGPNLDVVRLLIKSQYGAEIRAISNSTHFGEDRCRSLMRFLGHVGVISKYTGPLPKGLASGQRFQLTPKMRKLYNEVRP